MTLHVSVAVAWPDRQEVVELELADGSRVADALEVPAIRALLASFDRAALAIGIWSRRCDAETVLSEGDRVEIYRPLAADPKAQRRSRARLTASTRSRSGR